ILPPPSSPTGRSWRGGVRGHGYATLCLLKRLPLFRTVELRRNQLQEDLSFGRLPRGSLPALALALDRDWGGLDSPGLHLPAPQCADPCRRDPVGKSRGKD